MTRVRQASPALVPWPVHPDLFELFAELLNRGAVGNGLVHGFPQVGQQVGPHRPGDHEGPIMGGTEQVIPTLGGQVQLVPEERDSFKKGQRTVVDCHVMPPAPEPARVHQ